jgi:hypothetical protein
LIKAASASGVGPLVQWNKYFCRNFKPHRETKIQDNVGTDLHSSTGRIIDFTENNFKKLQ